VERLQAIDSDGHITEFQIDCAARFPPELRDRAPRVVEGDQSLDPASTQYSRTNAMLIDGYRFPDPRFEGRSRWATRLVSSKANPEGMRDPLQRLPVVDTEGIEMAVLYGTHISFYANSPPDWRYAQALCRAWNDATAEYCWATTARGSQRCWRGAVEPAQRHQFALGREVLADVSGRGLAEGSAPPLWSGRCRPPRQAAAASYEP
jgi:hypothetical protein